MQYKKSSLVGDKVLRLIFYSNQAIDLYYVLQKGNSFSKQYNENLGFV